jgi:hypothetical protein
MRIVDDETFGSKEEERVPFSDAKTLDDDQLEQIIAVEEGVGGEVRLELSLNAQLLDSQGIRISGTALLFEGTSEDTDDLDGQHFFNFVVRPGRTVNHTFRVRNTDEGGDFADVRFTCRNLPA